MGSSKTRQDLERELDELSERFLRGRNKELAKQIIDKERELEELKKEEDAG